MNESLVNALEHLIKQEKVTSMAYADVCRDLIQPTLDDLETFHDEEAKILQKAHDYLDEYLGGEDGVDGPTALQHVSDYLKEEARDFGKAAQLFTEFEQKAEGLGYFEEGYDIFFLAVLHYLQSIQLDAVWYRITEELDDTHQMTADAIVEHVRGILDNDFYALDHGLGEVRRSFAEALVYES